ncbi:CG32022 [Drosophila busckii]|uniref:CG32022 n=1 Tax=Drosophila busckii TaxID=30019 RepID=A0A0M4EK25_DROBS|nr:tail-anchored protein insertion receptor WRB [Drosophila busckii]ALC43510.1 CG32022 [Drosophila busckii]
MQLFILIALLCLLNTLLPDFIRNYLKVSRFWNRTSSYVQKLNSRLDTAREELDNERSAEHAGEYSRKIKEMRAERKVSEIEAEIKLFTQMAKLKQSTIDTVAYYVSKVLLSLMLIIVCTRNKHTPVMIFEDSFSLAPLGGLLSFPTGVYNAISPHAWALSCNFTLRLFYSITKK